MTGRGQRGEDRDERGTNVEHAPESVEIQDLANIAQQDEPAAPPPIAQPAEPDRAFAHETEPEAPAPIARPAEPKGAVAAATKEGSERAATEDGSEAANQVGHEAAPKDGSDRNVEAATTVRRDVKPRSTEILTQTATAPQLKSHRVPNPDAHVFVIEDGSEAAPEVGHEAANKVGKRNAKDDGNKTADDDWIEVRSKQHRRCKHMTLPPTLTAKGTSILRGHPKGGLPGNFPIVKIANHARVWLNKNKPSNNEGFYTSKVKSIFRFHKNKIKPKNDATARKVWIQDPKSGTRKVRPRKGRVARKSAGLVLTVTAPQECVGSSCSHTYEGRSTDDGRSVPIATSVSDPTQR
jgi:hypothetical protein